MESKIDWIVDKYEKFTLCCPYIAFYIALFSDFQKDGFLSIPWLNFQVDISWLLFAQQMFLLQYLALRENLQSKNKS